MSKKLTKKQAQAVIHAVESALLEGYTRDNKKISLLAIAGSYLTPEISRKTVSERLKGAKRFYQLEPNWDCAQFIKTEDSTATLEAEIKMLRNALAKNEKQELTRAAIRKHIFELKDYNPKPPAWAIKPPSGKKRVIGVPLLFASDWQFGEVIAASEINDFNSFNLEIATSRVRLMIEKACKLLFQEIQDPSYPGIVFALGGDMVSGDCLHDDLTITNQKRVMPVVLELVDLLIWCIDTLLEKFDHVHIPVVPGNHGRTTHKPLTKMRNVTNWDWFIGCMLERHYSTLEMNGVIDKGCVTFQVSDSPDCYFKIYNRTYCMTHGDQFRGGDGMIGPLGPVSRGRHKKQSRDAAMKRTWDTMMVGHFHWLIQMDHLIINGSLPGYSEFAYLNNMTPTRPAQALWITHPEEGITHSMPIYLDTQEKKEPENWLAIPA